MLCRVPASAWLVLVWKNCLGFSVGYQRAPGTSDKTKERLVPASASLPTAGSALHPWAGPLRFSGEAHPGPATLTQSSSFSCGAGLQLVTSIYRMAQATALPSGGGAEAPFGVVAVADQVL